MHKARFPYYSIKILTCTLVLGLLLQWESLRGQDAFYSYFSGSPLYLNPAETGNFFGDWRIAGNFRDQWRTLEIPYNTLSVSYDQQFYMFGNEFGVGVYAMNDQTGEVGIRTSRVHLSAAYQLNVQTHEIRFGLQGGINNLGYDFGNATFPSDYNRNTGVFDPSGDNNEQLYQFDLAAGVHYQTRLGMSEPNVGIAAFHLNNPVNSFYNNNEHLGLRLVSYITNRMEINDALYLEPKLFFMNQESAMNYMGGTEAGYELPGNSAVKQVLLGGYYRSGNLNPVNAVVLQAGAEIRRLTIVINYDVNTGTQTFGNTGAFELNFIYRSISTVLNSYSIPCDRF
ncbi:MAG: type IX secretion system membrane protein PorP/SprF [Bacteroidetes bacterium]|jgi:type IX secretion system PorP/SprF family membrane protein|nr:type IX secretion system membrane protein PorP/SprF [Bacteroidota bacterium]